MCNQCSRPNAQLLEGGIGLHSVASLGIEVEVSLFKVTASRGGAVACKEDKMRRLIRKKLSPRQL